MSLISRLKKNRYKCAAVIVAAGSSTRFGAEDKLFADLAGAPVLLYSLRAFERSEYINEIIVVADSEKIERVALLVEEYDIRKVSKVVCGGETRLVSALAGVSETEQRTKLIAIHDGARPLVSDRVIKETIENAKLYKAAIPVVPVRDTIKLVKDGLVKSTPKRSELFAVQTPQVFDRDLINIALSKAIAEKTPLTDDASAVEALGQRVRVCEGDENNFKITTPLDLKLAGELVRAEG